MRWHVFLLLLYVMLALEVGLRLALSWPGPAGVAPSFLLILAVYIALNAPPMSVAWAMLLIGLMADLSPIGRGDAGGQTMLIGPSALAYLIGGFALLRVRGMIFRRSPLGLAVMVLMAGLIIQAVIVALLTLRGYFTWASLWGQPGEPLAGWAVWPQVLHRSAEVLYAAVIALPLSLLLNKAEAVWGFTPQRQLGRGSYALGR